MSKTVSKVYGSNFKGVNSLANRMFSGGVQFEADITKLMKPKSRFPAPQKKKGKKKIIVLPPKTKSSDIVVGSNAAHDVHHYPGITGGVFDSPRNLALNIIAELTGLPLTCIPENRSVYCGDLGCFSRIGAFTTWTSSGEACGPDWGLQDHYWNIHAHCSHYARSYCRGERRLVSIDVEPMLFIRSMTGVSPAVRVRVSAKEQFSMSMPEGYETFGPLSYPCKRKFNAISRAKDEVTKLKRIVALIKAVAKDASAALSGEGSVAYWKEDKPKPIDVEFQKKIDPSFTSPTILGVGQ